MSLQDRLKNWFGKRTEVTQQVDIAKLIFPRHIIAIRGKRTIEAVLTPNEHIVRISISDNLIGESGVTLLTKGYSSYRNFATSFADDLQKQGFEVNVSNAPFTTFLTKVEIQALVTQYGKI